MPLYDYKCKDCEDIHTEKHSIAELDVVEIKCPKCSGDCLRTFETQSSIAFMSPEALGRKKANGDFRNFLSAIKKAHPGSAIRDH